MGSRRWALGAAFATWFITHRSRPPHPTSRVSFAQLRLHLSPLRRPFAPQFVHLFSLFRSNVTHTVTMAPSRRIVAASAALLLLALIAGTPVGEPPSSLLQCLPAADPCCCPRLLGCLRASVARSSGGLGSGLLSAGSTGAPRGRAAAARRPRVRGLCHRAARHSDGHAARPRPFKQLITATHSERPLSARLLPPSSPLLCPPPPSNNATPSRALSSRARQPPCPPAIRHAHPQAPSRRRCPRCSSSPCP